MMDRLFYRFFGMLDDCMGYLFDRFFNKMFETLDWLFDKFVSDAPRCKCKKKKK
jgi:hypothetical protein